MAILMLEKILCIFTVHEIATRYRKREDNRDERKVISDLSYNGPRPSV
jgi:hypothetical protein